MLQWKTYKAKKMLGDSQAKSWAISEGYFEITTPLVGSEYNSGACIDLITFRNFSILFLIYPSDSRGPLLDKESF